MANYVYEIDTLRRITNAILARALEEADETKAVGLLCKAKKLKEACSLLVMGKARDAEIIIREAAKWGRGNSLKRVLFVIDTTETGSDYGPAPISAKTESMQALGSALGSMLGNWAAKNLTKDQSMGMYNFLELISPSKNNNNK